MENHLSLGMQAPDFSATTTFGPVRMSDYKGKWLVFFSHPGDFTPGTKDEQPPHPFRMKRLFVF